MMKEQEETWICHYEEAIINVKVDKLWLAIKEQIHKTLEVYLEDLRLTYLFRLVKADKTSVCLMYKNFEQTQNENQDE